MAVNINFQSQDIAEAIQNKDIEELKKLSKDCPTLKALMNELTKMLSDVKGQAAPAAKTTNSSNANNGPSIASACSLMAEMMTLLSQLEVVTGKFTQLNSQTSDAMLRSMATVAQANMKVAENQYNKVINANQDESIWDYILKALEAIVAVVVSIIQPELAPLVLGLAAMSILGVFGEATKLVSDLLQLMGIPKEAADIMASILVIAATILVTVMTCGAAAPEAAAEVAGEIGEVVANTTEAAATTAETVANTTEAAATTAETVANTTVATGTGVVTEVVAEGAQEITNTTEEIVQQADEIPMQNRNVEAPNGAAQSTSEISNWTKVKEFMNKINLFNYLSRSTNLAILTGSQAVMQTNFADNLINFIAKYSATVAKEKDQIEEITNIILDVVLSLASLGSMTAASSAAADATTTWGKIAAKIAALSSKLPGAMTTLQISLFLASLAQAGGQAGLATTQFELANVYKKVGETKAMSELYNMMMTMTTTAATQNTSSQNALITSQNEALNSSVASWTKEYAAIAQAMSA